MQRSCADMNSPYKRKCWTNSGGPLVNSFTLWSTTSSPVQVQASMYVTCSTESRKIKREGRGWSHCHRLSWRERGGGMTHTRRQQKTLGFLFYIPFPVWIRSSRYWAHSEENSFCHAASVIYTLLFFIPVHVIEYVNQLLSLRESVKRCGMFLAEKRQWGSV